MRICCVVVLGKTFDVATSAEYFLGFASNHYDFSCIIVVELGQSGFELCHHSLRKRV